MEIFLAFILSLLFAWLTAHFAQKQGRDFMIWFLIGLVLGTTALLLAQETKSLLMGESADPEVVTSLTSIATEDSAVMSINSILTVHIGPRQVMVAMSVEFADNLRTPDLETKVAELEDRVHALHPEVIALFVKPQTPGRFMKSRQQRFGIKTPLSLE
jgi:divalent metal cation (Fe/Co/Zn/Cd) transporter